MLAKCLPLVCAWHIQHHSIQYMYAVVEWQRSLSFIPCEKAVTGSSITFSAKIEMGANLDQPISSSYKKEAHHSGDRSDVMASSLSWLARISLGRTTASPWLLHPSAQTPAAFSCCTWSVNNNLSTFISMYSTIDAIPEFTLTRTCMCAQVGGSLHSR